MAQLSQSQLEYNFEQAAWRSQKEKEDKIRLQREKTNLSGLREIARQNSVVRLFDTAHTELSPWFQGAVPISGALAFLNDRRHSVLRIYPYAKKGIRGVDFRVDIDGLVETIKGIWRQAASREAVIKAMPPMTRVPGTRWHAGTFDERNQIGELMVVFRAAKEDAYREGLKLAGDLDDLPGLPDGIS